MLNSIGFVLDPLEEKWQRNYELAKKYYEHYGNLLIPVKFKTIDGITSDENGINLSIWIYAQRDKFSNLTQERQQLLNSIGFVLDPLEEQWQRNYELVKKYYEHYGNLQIPVKFKTNDGYTYDENGINLCYWIYTQRKKLSNLTQERQQLLTKIGMVCNAKDNKDKIDSICIKYNIDIEKNKVILGHISSQELQSKIEFLIDRQISYIDENGLLIDIFSMSSKDMSNKYGISLEELIDNYYIKNKNKGV